MNIQYGITTLRPVMAVTIVPPPPETARKRFVRRAKSVGWALMVTLGALIAAGLWSLPTLLIGAPSLAGLGGILIGMVAYLVWDSGRG